jgi:Helix-turn-helix domain
MAERTLDIGEAARILGISTEAVRKRIKRGSLKAQKNGDGQWLVILDESRLAAGHRDSGGDGVQAEVASAATALNLVRSSAAIEEALRDEVDVLRDEIAFLRDEVARLETIIVSLTQNIKMLEAPRQAQPRMSWWHRLKSKLIGG